MPEERLHDLVVAYKRCGIGREAIMERVMQSLFGHIASSSVNSA
jgi:hypothetical protein